MSFTPDIPTTEDVLAQVLSSSLPALPPQEQRVGATTIFWWETDPGEVYVHAEGGTGDDRHYGSTLVSLQLESHGYKRAQFDLDPSLPTKGTSYDEGHPLNELAQRHPNVDLFASEDPSRGIKLHMIQVAPELQGQGHASAALRDLLSYADAKEMAVALTPGIPEGRRGLSPSALKAWYRSHGFLPNKGRNKDYAWMESMIRPPRTASVQDVKHRESRRYTSQRTAAWPVILGSVQPLMYHVAPASARSDIEANGIDWRRGGSGTDYEAVGTTPGNYLWTHEDQARYNHQFKNDESGHMGPWDLWAVDTSALPLQVDPYWDIEGQGPKAHWTTDAIPPERIRRLA